MAIRTYDILLDSYNSTIPEPIVGRQGDKNGAVTLHVTITDRGTTVDLTGQTINLMAETAKGTAIVADNLGVTLTDAVNGKFDYAIPNALWSESGKVTRAYFSLNDNNGQQTTYDLIFIVKKAIDINQGEADDYVTIIDGTIRDLKTKIDAIYADYQSGSFYNKKETESLMESLISNESFAINKLDYMTVSTTVSPTSMPSSSYEYKHLAKQDVGTVLVVMVNISSSNDYNPITMDDSRVQQAIDNATSSGVKVSMIKPHLGVNWSDGFDRQHYLPSNIDIFFENWTNILLQYAALCDKNRIPLLCIECEQTLLTDNNYLSYWTNLVGTLKSKYPNLLLTNASNSAFFDDNQTGIFGVVDIMGVNVYPSYTYKIDVSGSLTIQDIKGAYYDNIMHMNYMRRISTLSYLYHKKFFITETGVMPKDDGLVHLMSDHYADSSRDYHVQSLAMRLMFEELLSNKNICGFSWWHTEEPFDYFSDSQTTEAEQTMIDYVKKVK